MKEREKHQTCKDVSKGQNEARLENEHERQNERGEETCAMDGDGGINTIRLALLNENPISKRLTEFMGKKANKKERPKLASELRILTQMSYGEKALQILRAQRETMIFNYQLLCSQFQTREKRDGSKENGVELRKASGKKKQEIVK